MRVGNGHGAAQPRINILVGRGEQCLELVETGLVQPGKMGRWYEFRTYHVRQGAMAETIEAWKDAVPARVAMSPMAGAFVALDGEQPRFLNVWAYDSLEDRARIRAEAVREGVWPPKGGPANLTKMQSTVCAPVAFSPLA